MYPNLHNGVANALSEHMIPTRFHNNDSDAGAVKRYSTYVMGLFICDNGDCLGASWFSGKVAILIRGYPGDGYNAVVYGQGCELCERLGRFKMNEQSYVDRVAYRLMRWAGVEMERPVYAKRKTPPHRADLCEGCKRGVCEVSM
jgi:hypothetical protein